eukprot:COSAG01_NODE_33867_length_557_cov_0.903930_2_plen_88_part_00
MIDGPFGVNFDSDATVAATISPQLDASWEGARAFIVLRGVNVSVEAQQNGTVTVRAVPGGVGTGKTVKVRVVQGQQTLVLELGQPIV